MLPAKPDSDNRRGRWTTALGIALAVALALAAAFWNATSLERAIDHLPAAQRRALFSRTLQNLRSICAAPSAAMHDFCFHQARLIVQFRECDPDCARLANRQISRVDLPR